MKKKGLSLPFHTHEKDHGTETNNKNKLKKFSEEEKLWVKQKVKEIKQQRERKKKEDTD